MECAELNEEVKRMLNRKISGLKQAIHSYQRIVELMEALLPMIESVDAFYSNKTRIDEFIEQIFNDIQKGTFHEVR